MQWWRIVLSLLMSSSVCAATTDNRMHYARVLYSVTQSLAKEQLSYIDDSEAEYQKCIALITDSFFTNEYVRKVFVCAREKGYDQKSLLALTRDLAQELKDEDVVNVLKAIQSRTSWSKQKLFGVTAIICLASGFGYWQYYDRTNFVAV